ncbi:hypothetical protein Ga0100231_010410 [Opitutaceae bacterium TAV4]|nr:hypothetical protein Ga0100231_010410 [Opitutaceae bacterium TAV4]RRJ98757.1 hypothetical protein Ga0100230_010515 [Opitutaceae bacterium TAV3]
MRFHHSPFLLRAAALSAILVFGGTSNAVAEGWSVTFDKKFVASTGQAPSNAWKAQISPNGRKGPAVLLEKDGRLTYSSTDKDGAAIIPPVTGKIEFDFFPEPGRHPSYAAFDSGNILLFGLRGDSRLRAAIKLSDKTELKLVSREGLPLRQWTKITLEWNLTKPADQITLSIDGEVVDRKTTVATRLKAPADIFTWGMYNWGGRAWNGMYDNLTIK